MDRGAGPCGWLPGAARGRGAGGDDGDDRRRCGPLPLPLPFSYADLDDDAKKRVAKEVFEAHAPDGQSVASSVTSPTTSCF